MGETPTAETVGSSGATRGDMKAVLGVHAERPFSIPIDEQLELAQADRAQRMVQAGGLHGRIVLSSRPHDEQPMKTEARIVGLETFAGEGPVSLCTMLRSY